MHRSWKGSSRGISGTYHAWWTALAVTSASFGGSCRYFICALKEIEYMTLVIIFWQILDSCSVLLMPFLNRWRAWVQPWKSSSPVTSIKIEGQNRLAVQIRTCQGTHLTWPSPEMKLSPFSMPSARSLPALFSLRSFERCYGKDDLTTTNLQYF